MEMLPQRSEPSGRCRRVSAIGTNVTYLGLSVVHRSLWTAPVRPRAKATHRWKTCGLFVRRIDSLVQGSELGTAVSE